MYSYIIGFIQKFGQPGYTLSVKLVSCNGKMLFIYKSNTNSTCSGIIINVYFTVCVTINLNLFHNS